MGKKSPTLLDLLERLRPDASLAARHLWLMELLHWVRGPDGPDPQGAVARVRLLLDAAQARPEWLARWRVWWQLFLQHVDLAPLLADYGFAPRTAFLSEFGQRLRRQLLPGTPETTDPAELFDLLLPGKHDGRWIRALDPATLARLQDLLAVPAQAPALLIEPVADAAPLPPALGYGAGVLLDALAFSVSQVGATGFAAEIRARMSEAARQARAFHALAPGFEALREAVCAQGARSPAALAAASALRHQLDACRRAAYTVYAHLDEHGVSVGIVFRLRQLRERILRIKALLDCLQNEHPASAAAHLLAQLAQAGQDGRSLRALIGTSAHLTAAKVAERSAESGEHYITRTAAEYRLMLGKALGGGAVIAFATWVKFSLYALGLSAFWGGLAAGLNYAASFTLVMLLHWTVATKQPAVTAPAMAAKLKDMSEPRAVANFVDEVAHLLRSQMAAILGNVGAVVPVVLLIGLVLAQMGQAPMLSPDQAHQVLHDLSLLGPTALFAAFTGVLLFASSIIAGWVENGFMLHRLDSALAYNPRFTRVLGAARAQRWGRYARSHIAGLTASLSLGLMLGLVPALAGFVGLGLDVRHVTLSAGQVAAATATLGLHSLFMPAFWWAVAGVLVIGPLNLGVSFYLAFRLALAARSITGVDRQRIRTALAQRWRKAPASFVLPPKE